MDQHNLDLLPVLVFYLFLYVSKYHVRRDDVPLGGVLCDSQLNFAIWVPNKLEGVFDSPNNAANKNACPWIWIVFGQCLC